MASNFRISVHRNSDSLDLKLMGDFDGTSACELLNAMKENCDGVVRVFVNTSGLKDVYPFGHDTFQNSLYLLKDPNLSPCIYRRECHQDSTGTEQVLHMNLREVTRQGGVPMKMLKSGRLAAVFFVVSYFGVSLLGCATTSQIQALEERTQQALEKAEQAGKEARSAKAAVEDSAEYSYEAAASARRADNAASRAEDAASRAEKAAESAVWSAERAEKMAKKCEDIFRRIMSK